jgi:hypothetical protein
VVIAWSGKQGAKLTLSSLSNPSAAARASGQVNLDQQVSYRCMDWTKDASKFKAPTDVKIYDVTSLMINGKVQTGR